MEQQRPKIDAENAKFEPQSVPILCSNNCGFFGSPATNNLCSKCYKDHFLTKAKASLDAAALTIAAETRGAAESEKVEISADVGASSGDVEASKKKNPSRCSFCNKRVGLMGFRCRCDDVFCSVHRYSDKHNCEYDYKGSGQEAISKANPVIKADKIEKI